MENPMNKWMIWGYFYFWKHPYYEHSTKSPMDLSVNRFQEMSFSFLNEVDEYFTNVNFQEKTQGSLNTLPIQKQLRIGALQKLLDLKTFNQMCSKQSRKKTPLFWNKACFWECSLLSWKCSFNSTKYNLWKIVAAIFEDHWTPNSPFRKHLVVSDSGFGGSECPVFSAWSASCASEHVNGMVVDEAFGPVS